jgi:hypothetical protein
MNATEKVNQPITKKIEEQRFEFVLYINNNIICQRYFNIYDFNEDSIKSLELKEMMDNIAGMSNGGFGGMGIIPNYLKQKSLNYLWDNYNPYSIQNDESYKAPAKKGDVFKFEFKVDKRSVSEIEFPNDFFTLNPKVNIDIREIIPSIMTEIRQSLNQKNYTIIEY